MRFMAIISRLFFIYIWSINAEFLPNDQLAIEGPRTKFDDINFDVQILILENLSFPDLFNVAQISPYFGNVAAGIYRRNFAQKSVTIYSHWPSNPSMFEESDKITTLNCETATKFLKIFGEHVQSLTIHFSKVSKESAENITTVINDTGLKSLVELRVTDCPEHFWRMEQKPFICVETVAFENQLNTIKSLRFCRIFPNLRHLTLTNIKYNHLNCFNCKFSQLKELSIHSADVEKLLRKNPHIETMSVNYATVEILKRINRQLPNLTNLYIKWLAWNYFGGNIDLIQFENVTKAYIKSGPHRIPANVAFPRLRELEVGSEPSLGSDWIDYIAANSEHLTRLSVIDTTMNAEFLKLAERMTNLTEARVKCGIDVDSETVIEFVRANPRLRRMELYTFNAQIGDRIRNRLEEEWNVIYPLTLSYSQSGFESMVVTLERKELTDGF